MALRSILDLLGALAEGTFERLVGMCEGHEVDFKREPYRVDSPKGKWELAKDVAAFANASGGCIVIGVRTECRPNEAAEAATKVTPIRKELVSVSQYRDLISQWLVPPPRGIELRWYPDDKSAAKGLLLIRVPPATEDLKPVLVRKTVEADGDTVQTFGVPVRNQDRTEWEAPERIQHLLCSARLTQRVLMERASRASSEDQGQDPATRAKELLRIGGWFEEPCLVLQAQPPISTDLLAGMYGPDGIEARVRGWRGIRQAGFDLATLAEPQPGDLGLVFGGERWKARVGFDGWFELVVPVARHFLCWAMPESDANTETPLRINAVPLVEVTYDFFRLLSDVVAPRGAGQWTGWLRAMGMKSAGVFMHSGNAHKHDWIHPRAASSDSWVRTFPLSLDPAVDAFVALHQFYGLFALGASEIPFACEDRVLPEEIARLR